MSNILGNYVLADYILDGRHNIFEGELQDKTVSLSALHAGCFLEAGGTMIISLYESGGEEKIGEYLMKIVNNSDKRMLIAEKKKKYSILHWDGRIPFEKVNIKGLYELSMSVVAKREIDWLYTQSRAQ